MSGSGTGFLLTPTYPSNNRTDDAGIIKRGMSKSAQSCKHQFERALEVDNPSVVGREPTDNAVIIDVCILQGRSVQY